MVINKKQNADFSNTRAWFVDTVQRLRLKSDTISENIYFSLNRKNGRDRNDYDEPLRKSCSETEERQRERERERLQLFESLWLCKSQLASEDGECPKWQSSRQDTLNLNCFLCFLSGQTVESQFLLKESVCGRRATLWTSKCRGVAVRYGSQYFAIVNIKVVNWSDFELVQSNCVSTFFPLKSVWILCIF